MAPPRSSAGGSRRHRSTLSMQKTEILINVYDLLPPGRLSSILWTVGAGLLHSAVVINGKEYAYGGHDHKNLTGVYWTRPKTEPPGGTFRCEILHGFTLASDEEIENVIREASEEFQGTAYNLLTRNCNHFTSYLCQKLTGTPGPAWLNRAAAIGVAFPCVVPQEWIEPPDYDTAEGALLGEEPVDERARMLGRSQDAPHILGTGSRSNEEWTGDINGSGSKGKRQYSVSQTSLG